MRCPHCSSPKARPPVCGACGKAIDEPPHLPLAPDLEQTRAPPVKVEATRTAEVERRGGAPVEVPAAPRPEGLMTTDEELGRPPAKPRRAGPAAAPERTVCALCSVPNPPGRATCLACGHRL